MLNILAGRHRGLLQELAWAQVLLAFDFDGTLAPLVPRPEAACLAPKTRQLLAQLVERYPCIILSGRSQADVLRRVRGIGFREVIGNHGLEPWRRTEDFVERVQKWVPPLRALVQRFRGVELEDKHFSLAVHVRHCRAKRSFRQALAELLPTLEGLRVVGGKQVVNLLPRDAPDKGVALLAARERLGCDTALFVGDDETDEDVFRLREPGRLLSIRVGERRGSQAVYFLSDQREVDALLALLVELRPGEKGRLRRRV